MSERRAPRAAAAAVVIPAHNEAAVIERTLRPLAAAAAAGELEVVVVCNGCSDDTAERARRYDGVRVLELPSAAKFAALNAGDRAVRAVPRFYLDADIEISAHAIALTTQALADPGVLAARPPARYDVGGATWPVRQYYRARTALDSVNGALWGAGIYAVGAAGRRRFDEFPDLVSDDLWVDQLFAADEIRIVACDPVVVRAPRRSADLLKVLRRAQRGKRGVGRPAPGGSTPSTRAVARELASSVRRQPRLAVPAMAYAGFALAARRRAPSAGWERDNSSRVPVPAGPC